MPKKKLDPKEKAKREKIILACLAPVLLGLVAFQLPRVLKMLHQSSAAANTTPAATTVAGSSTTSLAPPSLGSGADAGASAGGSSAPSAAGSGSGSGSDSRTADGIVDPAGTQTAAAGQLVSFDRFRTKDPFVQQVRDCTSGCDTGAATSHAAAAPKAPVEVTKPARSRGRPAASAPSSPKAPAKVTTATISVNGVPEQVAVGKTFPVADPVFVLVSLTHSAARIAISGGDLASGAATVTLEKGKPLTLVNTADGSRYELRLLATS
jgi:hypothetical protein